MALVTLDASVMGTISDLLIVPLALAHMTTATINHFKHSASERIWTRLPARAAAAASTYRLGAYSGCTTRSGAVRSFRFPDLIGVPRSN